MKDTQTVNVFQLQRKILKYRNLWKRFILMIYHWILRCRRDSYAESCIPHNVDMNHNS